MRGVHKNLKFEYRLKYEESYETFYLLGMKWGEKKRNILAILLTVIGVIMLAGYYRDSQKIHYFFISLLDILLLYYLIYVPVLKAKKGARAVGRQGGIYKVELTREGKVRTGNDSVDLNGDADARAIETDSIFIVRPDRMHTFCLPKRIMTEKEIQEVREILKSVRFFRQNPGYSMGLLRR